MDYKSKSIIVVWEWLLVDLEDGIFIFTRQWLYDLGMDKLNEGT